MKRILCIFLLLLLIPTIVFATENTLNEENTKTDSKWEENVLFDGVDQETQEFDGHEIDKSTTQAFVEEGDYEKALVTSASKPTEPDAYGNSVQKVTVKFLSGDEKGKTVEIENERSEFVQTNLTLKKGEKVLIYQQEGVYKVADYYRSQVLLYFLGGFVLLLLIIGGKKGIFALLSLLITVGGLLGLGLPLILKGFNPILVAVFSTGVIAFVTILLVGGLTTKSISAILGTVIGVAIAGGIAYIGGLQGHITGLTMDEAQVLLYLPSGIELHPRELLFAGIIWGSLGAIMDVGMSIASAVSEVKETDISLKFKALFRSGMNVGRDVMGTMSNTLILAYLGSALPLILMISIWQPNFFKIINLDVIATEVIRSLAGSIGLILSIPLTAFFSALFIGKREEKIEDK
ncbi:MAG: YibE/F family protein [Tissierellia bacterium]|nr:YibE/F family protein [Tissierellia bacterium]